MRNVVIIEFEKVNEIFYYDETSPSCLRWKINYKNKSIGDQVGYINNNMWVVFYKGESIKINRIIWVLSNKQSIKTNKRLFYKDGNSLNTKIDNITMTKSSEFVINEIYPEDNKFCVYEHTDEHGNVLYIGSGVTSKRPYDKTGRREDHLAVFDSLKINIIKDGLTKHEAVSLEKELFEINCNSLKFNKVSPALVKPIIFSEVCKLFYYDESSPTFLRWKRSLYSKNGRLIKKEGEVAGTFKKNGYIRVYFEKKEYLAHRIVWSLCNNQDLITDLVIDHIDRNKSNNNIENLRLVTWSLNAFNKGVLRNNKSGVSGVYWCPTNNVWVSLNKNNGKTFNKTFDPLNLYPDTDFEEGKSLAFEDAVEYRLKFLEHVGVV